MYRATRSTLECDIEKAPNPCPTQIFPSPDPLNSPSEKNFLSKAALASRSKSLWEDRSAHAHDRGSRNWSSCTRPVCPRIRRDIAIVLRQPSYSVLVRDLTS